MTADFLSEKDTADVTARLRRIEGQMRGLQKMLEEKRDCAEVIQQLTAARAALDRVGNVIITSGLRGCLAEAEMDSEVRDRVDIGLNALAALRT
jgi:CsoR family transcriptional regulator, copper-sensing transcriptional repressor